MGPRQRLPHRRHLPPPESESLCELTSQELEGRLPILSTGTLLRGLPSTVSGALLTLGPRMMRELPLMTDPGELFGDPVPWRLGDIGGQRERSHHGNALEKGGPSSRLHPIKGLFSGPYYAPGLGSAAQDRGWGWESFLHLTVSGSAGAHVPRALRTVGPAEPCTQWALLHPPWPGTPSPAGEGQRDTLPGPGQTLEGGREEAVVAQACPPERTPGCAEGSAAPFETIAAGTGASPSAWPAPQG